jgi:hypothetical protein
MAKYYSRIIRKLRELISRGGKDAIIYRENKNVKI